MIVSELIEYLQQFPPQMTVVIDDADTNWNLNIDPPFFCDDLVIISGGYDDIYGDSVLYPPLEGNES